MSIEWIGNALVMQLANKLHPCVHATGIFLLHVDKIV
jgi:hypothetical protein